MRILTPYFVRIEMDPLFNKDGKTLLKKVKKDVTRLTKFLKNELGEGTIRMLTREDAEIIQHDVRGIGYGVQETQQLVGWEGDKTTSEIMLQELLCMEGENGIEFLLGGFGPQYFYDFIPKDYAAEAQAECSYSQLSLDDFMKATQDPMGLIGKESNDADIVAAESDSMACPLIEPIPFDNFIDRFKKLSLVEFYVPVVVEFEISK